jgi:hypothetical protein
MLTYDLTKIPNFLSILSNVDEPIQDPNIVCVNQTRIDKCNDPTLPESFERSYRIYHYDKSTLTKDDINVYGLLRSLIVNASDHIVCFSPPKSLSSDVFINKYPAQSIFQQYLVAEEFVEGTMINVFWDEALNGFEFATRNNVGANVTFYKGSGSSNKTFKTMFTECATSSRLDINTLNKRYCYSFVMQHPENRIVVPFSKPQLYLIATYDIHNYNDLTNMQDATVMQVDRMLVHDWSSTDVKFPEVYTGWHSYDDLINKYASSITPYSVLGVMITNKRTGERCKFRNPIYEVVRKLRGNHSKPQYLYLTLRQEGKVGAFLHYFPEYNTAFMQFREMLHAFTYNLHANYVNCYIKKEKPISEYPKQFRTHMFKLHEKYVNELKPMNSYVSNAVTIDYVNTLLPAHLMYSLNYNLRPTKATGGEV